MEYMTKKVAAYGQFVLVFLYTQNICIVYTLYIPLANVPFLNSLRGA